MGNQVKSVFTLAPSARLSRRARERERHRQEILAAAEQLFARKGYRATTVEEIAQEAEFAVGTLYLLFKDKDELYLRIIEGFANEFIGHFERDILPLADANRAVAALIELRLQHYHRHQAFIRRALEAMPALRVDPLAALPRTLDGIHERHLQALTELFARGIAQRAFVRVDPLYLAICLEGTLHALVARWSMHKPAESWDALVAHTQQQFMELIKPRSRVARRGLAQGPTPAPTLMPTGDPQ